MDIDVKGLVDILNSKYFVHFIIALGIACATCYFIKQDYFLFGFVLAFAFLLILAVHSIISWFIVRCHESKTKKKDTAFKNSMMEKFADEALVFFKGLSSSAKKHAVDLYNHDRSKSKYENERYVAFGEEPGFGAVLSLNEFTKCVYSSRPYAYIGCDNEEQCCNGGTRHIVFDPFFYEVVKNYVITGKEDYPSNFNPIDYEGSYQSELRYAKFNN